MAAPQSSLPPTLTIDVPASSSSFVGIYICGEHPCLYGGAHCGVHVHVCVYTYPSYFSHSFTEAESPAVPGTSLMNHIPSDGIMGGHWSSSPVGGRYLTFHLHACTASVLSTEPSSQPPIS